ncbi:SERPINF2 isoform 4, partial [Pan troglodytes]
MALLWGLLVLSWSCLQGPCSVFSPVSAMEPLGRQLTSGPNQEQVSPLTLLKLGNQEPGGQTALKSPPGVCSRDPTPEQTRRLARAMMAFTADLFSLVAQTSTCPNLILSPLSVALALSHLALGFWRNKFDPSLTQRDSFHLDEQFTVPVEMMQARTYPLRWFLLEQPEIQVAHFPFKNNMSFVVLVPTHFEWNVSQVLANLSWDTLHPPLVWERPTKVRLPKLYLKHQMDLVATLSQLGLQELFQAPDLRGISEQSLVVSGVQH